MKIIKIFSVVLAALILSACQHQEELPKPSSQMKIERQVLAPKQAIDFCNRHKGDFEKCPTN